MTLCGQDVFPKGFTLVESNDSQHSEQELFYDRFETSHKVCCDSPIESAFYSLKQVAPICYRCGCDLSKLDEILNMYASVQFLAKSPPP